MLGVILIDVVVIVILVTDIKGYPHYNPHHHSVFDMCATPDRGSAEMDEI